MPGAAQPGARFPASRAVTWLWAGGSAFLVFAVRCREIALYAGDTPYFDQWRVEAQQILVPWLEGHLTWTDFFAPHHEHFLLWTRLLAWLQAAVLGRWDPLLQCTVNAAFFGLAVAVWSDWVRRTLPLVPALGLSLLAVALAGLPHGWENSTWGFQSLIPLALLFVLWHIRGSFEAPIASTGWWLAQAAGLASLFTLGSVWTASAAVVLTAGWTSASGRWRWLSPALLALAGLVLLFVARSQQAHIGAYTLAVDTPQQFLAAFLLQLGWPSLWPGAPLLLQLPVFLLALQLRRNASAQPVDRIALALGLFAVAQAAAFAYGRGGGSAEFVSRYGDLLAVGVMANGFALWRLLHGHRRWRPVLALLALAWLAALVQGLHLVSTRGHTEYFHAHAADTNRVRHDAVHGYLATHDPAWLSGGIVREKLYPDPLAVASILDVPGLRELLPAGVRGDGKPVRGDVFSIAARRSRELWPALAGAGIILLLLGTWGQARTAPSSASPSPAGPHDPGLPLVGGLAVAAGGLLFLWPMPFEFRAEKRWSHLLLPPTAIAPLGFRLTTPTAAPVDSFAGQVPLWPEELRQFFSGTCVGGEAFTGRVESTPFPIDSPWFVIPFVGFPMSSGNGLRLQIETPAGQPVREIGCAMFKHAELDFWGVDVRADRGLQARLVFYDGRNGTEGWLGAAPPQPAQDRDEVVRLQQLWALERTAGGHLTLGVIFLFLALLLAGRFVQSQSGRGPATPPGRTRGA